MIKGRRLKDLKAELRKRRNPAKAKILQGFFKTGPGEYAEGDIFLGVEVPVLRSLANQYSGLSLSETLRLLASGIHEERLLALLLLILRYQKSGRSGRHKVYKAYLRHTRYINNWDLVDLTARQIVGDYLYDKEKAVLYRLARSASLWERRIAIVATFHFIERKQFRDTFKVAEALLSDEHDLIHKAAGWMLREVGKRDRAAEERFLKKHYKTMPRTMLRYAIERFPERTRKAYLNG
ncbi:MAG: DNA alkylation repair protein [Candidatus Omnitrophica bacterium]|nr:DNA alkylation repair protein [Candidatus Omnitrophota bacterium]